VCLAADVSVHWQGLVGALDALLEAMKQQHVPDVLVQAMFQQLFCFANVVLFNHLLLRSNCCSSGKGESIGAGLELLEGWVGRAGGLYTGSPLEELRCIRQVPRCTVHITSCLRVSRRMHRDHAAGAAPVVCCQYDHGTCNMAASRTSCAHLSVRCQHVELLGCGRVVTRMALGPQISSYAAAAAVAAAADAPNPHLTWYHFTARLVAAQTMPPRKTVFQGLVGVNWWNGRG
jgi:hypothetical protein